jgi:hypothetical protein
VLLSFRASPSAFAPASPIRLTTDTPEWRDPNTNSANQVQWATLPTGNRNKRTQYIAALIVCLSTIHFEQTSGAVPTLQQKKPRNSNHQRNQDFSLSKFSDNEVSAVFSFRTSPSAFTPSAPILLSKKTHPSGEIQRRIQQNTSNGRSCQHAIATSALDTWWY